MTNNRLCTECNNVISSLKQLQMKKIYIGIIFLLLLKITINSIIAVNNKANKQVKTKQTKTKSTTENKKSKTKNKI